jgi:hypothetical protein
MNAMNRSIKTEIIINASKERVWEVLTDFESYPSWNPFIVNIKGDLMTSHRLVNTLSTGKGTVTFKPVILSVVPYQYFDWLGNLFIRGLFDGHHYFEIDELSSTQVKFTQGEHFSGIFCSHILKKVSNVTRNNFIKMNSALRQRVEATI